MSKLILVSGEEDFLVERCIQEIISSALITRKSEYELPSQLELYLAESSSPTLDMEARAFVLRGGKEAPQLPICKDDIVIYVGGSKKILDPRTKTSYHFPKLKSFNDNNEVVGWILKEGNRRTIDLKRIAVALFVNSGKSLRKLSSEIEKIAALVPRGTVVSPEDAMSVMCFSAELTPREIVESVCSSNPARALAFYGKLQENNDETGWILAYMMRFVATQLRSDMLLKSGVSEDRAASILGVHPFIYKKTFSTQNRRWPKAVLQTYLGKLCDLDILHKRGVDVKCNLELCIKLLSEEAGDVR